MKTTNNPYNDIDRAIIADAFTSDEATRVLYTLCDDIGTRFAGTEGERLGAEFIARTFEEYGLDSVEIEEFDFLGWRRGEPAALQTLGDSSRSIPCFALPYGAATDGGGVEGEIIDVGPGSAEDVAKAGDNIRGRVVLTDASGAHRSEIYGRVAAAGAAAFIFSGRAPGMMIPTGCVSFGSAGPIPALGIAFESGLLFQRLLLRGTVRVRVSTFDRFEDGVSRNVVGEVRGTSHPNEFAIVGGHMDSHEVAPGAVDNASGATCVIETARLLALQKGNLARSVRFVTFGSEEVGLLGSYAYAERHSDEMDRARLMLNLDCLVMSRPKGIVSHFLADAESYVATLREQMREPLPFVERLHAHSDHFPFVLKGVPTAELGGGMFNPGVKAFAHMAGDTPDKVSEIDLREESALAARFLVRATNDLEWPFVTRTEEEVNALLQKTGIAEKLAFERQGTDTAGADGQAGESTDAGASGSE